MNDFRRLNARCVALFAAVLLTSGISRAGTPPKPAASGQGTVAPSAKDGFIDYESVLNERLGRDITPETNANVLIWKALGPNPEGTRLPEEYFQRLKMKVPSENGNYFIRPDRYLQPKAGMTNLEASLIQAGQRPWIAKDQPQLAAWLKANEAPLEILREAMRRPHYFNPLVAPNEKGQRGPLFAALLPSVQSSRNLARALIARAMLRVGEGDSEAAWQDLLTAHRLGRLVGRGPTLIEGLVGYAIEAMCLEADLAWLDNANLTADQLREHVEQLQALPALPSAADKVDLGERLIFLDSMQLVRRQGGEAELRAIRKIDWVAVIRVCNAHYDKIVAAMRLKVHADQTRELHKVTEELNAEIRSIPNAAQDPMTALKNFLGPDQIEKTTGKTIGTILLSLFTPALENAKTAEDRIVQRRRNLRVAFALAAYHRDHRQFPRTLKELAPKYITELPGDLFSGNAIIYRPDRDGYLLYSVGANGQDDRGRADDDKPEGDDLRVKIPVTKHAK